MKHVPMKSRMEFLFLKDGRMINLNGDPNDDNRSRRLQDGRVYTSDVCHKRVVRDQWDREGAHILIKKYDGGNLTVVEAIKRWMAATNVDELMGRPSVKHQLKALKIEGVKVFEAKDKVTKDIRKKNPEAIMKNDDGTIKEVTGRVAIIALTCSLKDIRMFGSTLAVKAESGFKPVPSSLTGPVQIAPGRVLHQVEEVPLPGTTVMRADDTKQQGTFTDRSILRYALHGINGICNEHNAAFTGMTEEDFNSLINALWVGTRNHHSHSKVGQVPRFVVVIQNKEGNEHQFGNLIDYVEATGINGIDQTSWDSPKNYKLDISLLIERLAQYGHCIESVQFDIHPDMQVHPFIPESWEFLNLDKFPSAQATALRQQFRGELEVS